MSLKRYLETAPVHTIAKYAETHDYSLQAVAYTGSPRKHPYDSDKIILIQDPFSSHTEFFEFRLCDILGASELPNIATESGENVLMVKIWIKKGTIGLKYVPFEVQEQPVYMCDSSILHQVMKDEFSQ